MDKMAIIEMQFATPLVTEETIEDMKNRPKLHRGHINTSLGKVYKAGEFESRSDLVLNKKLP